MARAPKPPHADALPEAVAHFNNSFRRRYRLPATTVGFVQGAAGFDEAFADLATIRMDGVADASCALIARAMLSITPRYAIGFLDAFGQVTVLSPDTGDPEAYRSHWVLLINPIGGRDNWSGVSRHVRKVGGDKSRRTELAGLASEERPDQDANDALLYAAMIEHDRAVALPPDEAFSAARAAEVNFVYGVPIETLRSWKRTYRRELAAGKVGAPRTKPVRKTPSP